MIVAHLTGWGWAARRRPGRPSGTVSLALAATLLTACGSHSTHDSTVVGKPVPTATAQLGTPVPTTTTQLGTALLATAGKGPSTVSVSGLRTGSRALREVLLLRVGQGADLRRRRCRGPDGRGLFDQRCVRHRLQQHVRRLDAADRRRPWRRLGHRRVAALAGRPEGCGSRTLPHPPSRSAQRELLRRAAVAVPDLQPGAVGGVAARVVEATAGLRVEQRAVGLLRPTSGRRRRCSPTARPACRSRCRCR